MPLSSSVLKVMFKFWNVYQTLAKCPTHTFDLRDGREFSFMQCFCSKGLKGPQFIWPHKMSLNEVRSQWLDFHSIDDKKKNAQIGSSHLTRAHQSVSREAGWVRQNPCFLDKRSHCIQIQHVQMYAKCNFKTQEVWPMRPGDKLCSGEAIGVV